MHYGINIPNFGDTGDPRTLAEMAREAEQAGWDGFFLWDHMMIGSLPTSDPWVALTAIALATERIRIGTMVTPVPRRRPAKLAREAATLDVLSNGRLILGVGIGLLAWEWEEMGEEADTKQRGAMLDEALDVMTEMWSGEPVRHHGTYYHVDVSLPDGTTARFLPRPQQQPRIPIWVAGMWPNKPPFRRAARWDGIFPIKAVSEFGKDPAFRPAELRAAVDYTRAHRTSDAPFDVIVGGVTDRADADAAAQVAAYAEAGATWWMEDISPWPYGWDWQGPWPVAAMWARVRQGPPK
jgi:alkanesulfonate monooxygenase SsuD/methylene tetrahydromethanopterin reductase-like flavin-dependent oxidoreductase (luciferase family)